MTTRTITIVTDGGTAEIYSDIFADMLTMYVLAMGARQKKAQDELAAIKLDDDYRTEKFQAACFNYDDAVSRERIAEQVEKVFKNRGALPLTYVQERE